MVLLTGVATVFADATDSLTIRVTYIQPQAAQVVAHQSIDDSAQVQATYQIVMHLPDVPRGATYFCPIERQTYYQYALVFTRRSIPVVTMQVNARSCQFLYIDTLVKWNNSTKIANDSFWAVMQQQTQIDPFTH